MLARSDVGSGATDDSEEADICRRASIRVGSGAAGDHVVAPVRLCADHLHSAERGAVVLLERRLGGRVGAEHPPRLVEYQQTNAQLHQLFLE